MTYTGMVSPGGPAAVRELDGLTIRKASVSEMDNNVYLLTCTSSGTQALIDAADDAARLLALVQEGGGGLDLVVTTHQHWDHHRALAEVLAATSARSAAGADDAEALPVAPDVRLEQGDTVTFGDVTLDVLHLRGHTPGSVALAWTEPSGRVHLFTGDSLFPGGVGNVNKDPERFASLLADVQERVFDRYDDRTWVYPGHGADTTLGAERPSLPLWRERGW
jgi:glyoxylase-like metal-dependent hydrolase (beta-lactamase superfamily II)